MRKKKVSRLLLAAVVVLVVLTILALFFSYPKLNSDQTGGGNILLGEKPANIVPSADWLSFTTDAPFTFSYPTTWGIEAAPGEDDKQGVHVVGPEGEIFMYWGSGFGGACESSSMVEVKLKEETLKVCDEKGGEGSESWRLVSKQISPEVGFDARASANAPTDKNREMILAILSTLSFKK